jgi:nicotinate-nucleotide pyrophosphorylase (carboxylating)
MKIDPKYVAAVINNAIKEDLGSADITTKGIIKFKQTATGRIRAKQAGIICGQDIAASVFYRLNKDSKYRGLIKDGHKAEKGDIIAEIKSDLKSLLSGERIALNFLMHLSGIATLTSQYVEAVKGLKVKILDTRKTTPGLRLLEKQAVKTGGGDNHRIGLYDMYLIKDNHIEAAGSISKAIEACLAHRGGKKTKIEIEAKYLSQIKEALKYKIDRIMLDNMTPNMMKKAVRLIRELNSKIEIEASGNVSLKSVRKIAQTGVDLISIGKLTHSAPALDLSMDISTNG